MRYVGELADNRKRSARRNSLKNIKKEIELAHVQLAGQPKMKEKEG